MTDIYNAEQLPPTNENTQQPPVPALTLPDEVAALVGPGKKYATLELALKSIPAAQTHIAKLEAEARERAAVDPAKIDEVYETVQELLKAQGKPPVQAGLDEAAIASLFDRLSDQRTQAQKESDNVASFKSVFDKQFGEKAKEAFASKAAEVGLSVAQLSALVKSSPEAALRLTGLKAPDAPKGGKLTGSINTETFDHTQRPPQEKRNLISGGAKKADLRAEWAEITKAVHERNGITQ